MDEKKWLETLQVGDKVFVDTSWAGVFSGYYGIVKRTTRTMFHVENEVLNLKARFRRRNGFTPGAWKWRTSYFLRKPTEEIKNKLQIDRLRRHAIKLRASLSIPQTIEGLEKFINCLSELIENQSGPSA